MAIKTLKAAQLLLFCFPFVAFADENIVTYGALAGSANDSTAAIQAAMNAACSSNGKVYVPGNSNSYYVKTATLIPACDLVFVGDRSAIEYTDVPEFVLPPNTSTMTFFGAGIQTNYYLRIEHIELNGSSNGAAGIDFQGAGKSLVLKNVSMNGFLYGVKATTSATLESVYGQMIDIRPDGTNGIAINVQNANSVTLTRPTIVGTPVTQHAVKVVNVKAVTISRAMFSAIGAGPVVALTTGSVAGCPSNVTPYKWSVSDSNITSSLSAVAATAECGNTVSSVSVTGSVISGMTDTNTANYGSVFIRANCGAQVNTVSTNNNTFDHIATTALALVSSPSGSCTSGTPPGIIDHLVSKNDLVTTFSTAYPNTLPAIASHNGGISPPSPPTGSPTSYLVHALIDKLATSGGPATLWLAAFWDVSII